MQTNILAVTDREKVPGEQGEAYRHGGTARTDVLPSVVSHREDHRHEHERDHELDAEALGRGQRRVDARVAQRFMHRLGQQTLRGIDSLDFKI